MKKMLIISALDIWSMGDGRGAPSLALTLQGYADRGWQVFFVTGNKTKDSVYNFHPNVNVTRFDGKWIKRFYGVKYLSFILKLLWWFYFQVIAFLIGISLIRKHQIRLIYGYDTMGVPCSFVLSKLFSLPMISRFQGTTIGYFRHLKFWHLKFWDHILALKIPSNLLIMTNDGQEEDKLLQSLDIDMNRVRFWMNGVNKSRTLPEGFNPGEFKKTLGITMDSKVILAVNRLHKWKRIDRIISAMPEISAAVPEVILLIVGDGDEYPGLVELVRKLGVEEKVKFLGPVKQAQVPIYLVIADVFISCNDSSNVGNPLLEAMVWGKCIVTLDNGTTGKFINGETGVLVPLNHVHSMGKEVINLLLDENRRLTLGQNAQQFAAQRFWTWEERMAREVSEVEEITLAYLASGGDKND